jgi:hypothetical protein
MQPGCLVSPFYRDAIFFASQTNKSMKFLDWPSSHPRFFSLLSALPDIRPGFALSFNGNVPGASGSMLYHSFLANSLVLRDLLYISSVDISDCQRIPCLSFWFVLAPSRKIVFMRFHRSSLSPHDCESTFLTLLSFEGQKLLSSSGFCYDVMIGPMKAPFSVGGI